MDKIEISNNEFNYFAYNIDKLINLHYELQYNFKLYSFMNNSKCQEFIKIILNNLTFYTNDNLSDDENSDNDIINLNENLLN